MRHPWNMHCSDNAVGTFNRGCRGLRFLQDIVNRSGIGGMHYATNALVRSLYLHKEFGQDQATTMHVPERERPMEVDVPLFVEVRPGRWDKDKRPSLMSSAPPNISMTDKAVTASRSIETRECGRNISEKNTNLVSKILARAIN